MLPERSGNIGSTEKTVRIRQPPFAEVDLVSIKTTRKELPIGLGSGDISAKWPPKRPHRGQKPAPKSLKNRPQSQLRKSGGRKKAKSGFGHVPVRPSRRVMSLNQLWIGHGMSDIASSSPGYINDICMEFKNDSVDSLHTL